MLLKSAMVVVGVVAMACGAGRADILWSETNGDLSNVQSSPRYLDPIEGSNPIIGSVGGADIQDWFTMTIPGGYQLSSIILVSYVSSDPQAFIGFQIGPTFVGSPFVAGSYAGYAHVGTVAVNGTLPPTDLTGADLLAVMADPAVSQGATGFVRPLEAGQYAFLFQQLGTTTDYELNFVVTAVPGPGTAGVAAIGMIAMGGRRRRRVRG